MSDILDPGRRALIQSAGVGLALGLSIGDVNPALAQGRASPARFTGKRILITGGSSGIGRAGARRIAAEGGRVVVTGQTPAHLEETRRELPADSLILCNDSGDPAAVSALVDVVRLLGGGVDGLWLNAGFTNIGLLEKTTTAGFDRMMAVNARGPMLQLAALSPFLNPGASVLLTSSSSAYEGAELTSLYGATKGAMLSMARSWARQLASRQIRVNTIVPGPIRTNIRRLLPAETRRQLEAAVVDAVPLKRMGSAEEAAAVALFLLSEDASFVSGSQYAVDGGMMMQ